MTCQHNQMTPQLEHEAKEHEAVASRLEEDARNRRWVAERYRKSAQYLRKRRLMGSES